ncbi:hypothetical protein LguiA_009052 [Lonicera macranthoides]
MAIRMPRIINAKPILRRSSSSAANVPKGCFAVYVGDQEKKRFVIPISFLNSLCSKTYQVNLKKNSGFSIQWVVSQFPAVRNCSLISLLA